MSKKKPKDERWEDDPLYFGGEPEPPAADKRKSLRDRLDFNGVMDSVGNTEGNKDD